VPSFPELVAEHAATMAEDDLDWLHRLLADWQLLADLSFADLVLWLPAAEGRGGFVAVAQMRPATGPTALHADLVGTSVPAGRRVQLDRAFTERRICREQDPDWPADVPVREETFPVVRTGRVLAVVSRHTNLAAARTPSRLELTYLRAADDLVVMVAQGRFPVPGETHQVALAPRVGDGLARLDAAGVVTFASPNAVSAYRRLGLVGDLVGTHLGGVTAELAGSGRRAEPVDEALAMTISGWAAREAEVEAAGATVRLRVIPLDPDGVRAGALVLCRDVTELRRRERELVGKEATIREIHHRVKNNLQTVAALLRLQSRRLHGSGGDAARAALAEAERRIASIAVVHETLARTGDAGVEFDDVADEVTGMVAGMGGTPARLGGQPELPGPVVRREGTFGVLPPEVATPLALVLAELVQNAVEHGRSATLVRVVVARVEEGPAARLRLQVVDDGAGLPAAFDRRRDAGLGLQIVGALVEGELSGRLELRPRGKGTEAAVDVPLPPPL